MQTSQQVPVDKASVSVSPKRSRSIRLRHIPARCACTYLQELENPLRMRLQCSLHCRLLSTHAFACEMSFLWYKIVAQACCPSLPALPNSWAHESTFSGTPLRITFQMSALSIPIPNALVATMIWTSPDFHFPCDSHLEAESISPW